MITRDELEVIWDALFDMRENCIPEGDPQYDAKWSDICTTMHKIEEELEIWESVSVNPDAMINAVKSINKDIREGL
jgi:hypothetical protein